jgi:hypothetical protein
MPSNLTAKGLTVLVATGQTAPAGVQCGAGDQTTSYLLYNDGTVTAFMAAANTPGAAQIAAVIPTAAGPQKVYPVPAKGYLPVTDIASAYWSGVTGSGTANVFVTPVYPQNT